MSEAQKILNTKYTILLHLHGSGLPWCLSRRNRVSRWDRSSKANPLSPALSSTSCRCSWWWRRHRRASRPIYRQLWCCLGAYHPSDTIRCWNHSSVRRRASFLWATLSVWLSCRSNWKKWKSTKKFPFIHKGKEIKQSKRYKLPHNYKLQ